MQYSLSFAKLAAGQMGTKNWVAEATNGRWHQSKCVPLSNSCHLSIDILQSVAADVVSVSTARVRISRAMDVMYNQAFEIDKNDVCITTWSHDSHE